MVRIVGVIYGSVGYNDFNFIVGKDSDLQKGGYVKVGHDNYGWVLAQVEAIKRYNDKYSLNALMGGNISKNGGERIEATAKVIGFLDEKKMLKVPKIPFKPGSKVYEADSNLVKSILKLGSAKGIYLGKLYGHNDDIKIFLNINKMVQKHVSVLAKTGAGKSYTVGVLIEELLDKRVPVVIIDPHGEYSALKKPNTNPKEMEFMQYYGVQPKGYDNIVEYTTDPNLNPQADRKLSLDISHFSLSDFQDMLPTRLTDSQKGILFEAIKTVKSYGKFSLEDIIKVVADNESKSKWNLITSLDMLKESKIFEGGFIYPRDLVKKNLASIINLRGVPPDIQNIVVSRLAMDIFEARKRGKVPPLLFLLEEAHNFIPERGFGRSSALKIIRTVAAEGRKFGMGLAIVSQRPAKVDKSVLSQCNTQIILKVTNPNDLKAISQSIEGFTNTLEEDIKQLDTGLALVVGEVVEQPVFIDVRVKKSRHGGASIEVVKEGRPKKKGSDGLLRKLFLR